jgi:hypothetical protein
MAASQAIIVRLYKPVTGKASKATFEVLNLTLEAASEGAWGMQVHVRVDKKPTTDPNLQAMAQRLGVQPADLFDLTMRDGGTGVIETFLGPVKIWGFCFTLVCDDGPERRGFRTG